MSLIMSKARMLRQGDDLCFGKNITCYLVFLKISRLRTLFCRGAGNWGAHKRIVTIKKLCLPLVTSRGEVG